MMRGARISGPKYSLTVLQGHDGVKARLVTDDPCDMTLPGQILGQLPSLGIRANHQ